MPKEVVESSFLKELKKKCVDVAFEDMVYSEHSVGEMMIGHDNLKGFLQFQQFFDSVATHILCFGYMVG